MSSGTCPICQSADIYIKYQEAIDYLSGHSFRILRCSRCRFAFTDPPPGSIEQYYPAQYRQYMGPVARLQKFLYQQRARKWSRNSRKTGLALEIGCGEGLMLEALRGSGWRTIGTERNQGMAARVKGRTGLAMIAGDLDAIAPAPIFDLILIFQVLEHVADPLKALRQCRSLLAPGGVLIIGVPNFDSWQSRFAGPVWFHLDVPRHRSHFCPESLEYALCLAGMRMSKLSFASFEHDPYGWVESAFNRLLGPGARPYNKVTRTLMGIEQFRLTSSFWLATAAVAFVTALPFSIASWMSNSGALMEVTATRDEAARE